MSRASKIDEILKIVKEFGLNADLLADEGTIKIAPAGNFIDGQYIPKEIEISVDDKEYVFMQIDNFFWEFDDNFSDAKREIRKYISSLAQNKLKLKGIKYINQKLEAE